MEASSGFEHWKVGWTLTTMEFYERRFQSSLCELFFLIKNQILCCPHIINTNHNSSVFHECFGDLSHSKKMLTKALTVILSIL